MTMRVQSYVSGVVGAIHFTVILFCNLKTPKKTVQSKKALFNEAITAAEVLPTAAESITFSNTLADMLYFTTQKSYM